MFAIILLFFLILNFLIFSHEFGHFILAKLLGVRVEEFGFGWPPRVFGVYTEDRKKNWFFGSSEIKTKSTIYSLNLIPFGGFNKIYGEEVKKEKELKDSESFAAKSVIIRTLIVSGGVLAGILVAVVIFYFILSFNQFTAYQGLLFEYKFPFGSQKNLPMVIQALEGSPAEKAKLVPYDLVLEVEGQELKNAKELTEIIKKSEGKELSLIVKSLRTKETKKVIVIPQVEAAGEEAKIGIGLREVAEIRYENFFEKIFAGFLHSANLLHYSLVGLSNLLKISFLSHSISPLASQTIGIVGVFALTKLTLQGFGLAKIFNLIALFSLALAFTNFLPLPALDGGRLILLGYEALFKKKVPPLVERKINTFGFIGLIFLCLLIIYKDILQYKEILFKW